MAHVNTKSGATYTFIHKFNEPYLPSLPSHRVSQPFWTVLISHPTESRRLRWPGGAVYIPRQYTHKTKRSPISVLNGLDVQ